MDDAGFKVGADGTRFKLKIVYDAALPERGELAAALKSMWREAGIDVETAGVQNTVMLQQAHQQSDFEAYLTSYATYSDPAMGIGRAYISDAIGRNYGNASLYRNAEVDRLFAEAQTAVGVQARGDIYRKIQHIVMDELPAINLFDSLTYEAFSVDVKDGFKWANGLSLGKAWLDR